jgi:hypothetical protein
LRVRHWSPFSGGARLWFFFVTPFFGGQGRCELVRRS